MKRRTKQTNLETKKNSLEGIRLESNSDLYDTMDRYPGDSVNEHKAIEEANEFFADKEIEQVDNNL